MANTTLNGNQFLGQTEAEMRLCLGVTDHGKDHGDGSVKVVQIGKRLNPFISVEDNSPSKVTYAEDGEGEPSA
jgi:hypothetical protein